MADNFNSPKAFLVPVQDCATLKALKACLSTTSIPFSTAPPIFKQMDRIDQEYFPTIFF